MKKQLTALFFMVSIFGVQLAPAYNWRSSIFGTLQYITIPDITTAVTKEFDTICQIDSQDQILAIEITFLKHENVPMIIQHVEYQHAKKPFKNLAAALFYAFSLARSTCIDFYKDLVNKQLAMKLKNPPVSPEFMDLKVLHKNVVAYLHNKALTELSNKGTIGMLLKNLNTDIDYALHLGIKFSSPLF